MGETGTARSALNSYGASEATGGKNGSTNTTDPLAFVTILIFDRNYTFLDVSYAQLVSASQMTASYTIKQPGYAFMYISNEQPYQTDVFFDDVTVAMMPGSVMQVQDYYPFGATFNSYTRENSLINNRLYNAGSELQSDLGIDVYETDYRMLDSKVGRWWQVDPKVDNFYDWSPYNYAFNNPSTKNDPKGDCPFCAIPLIFEGAVAAGLIEAATVAAAGATILTFGDKIVDAISASGASATMTPGVVWAESLRGSSSVNSENKSQGPPNPNGSKGKPDHQEKVKELEKKAQNEKGDGETVLTEKKIQNENSNRRPDVQIVNKDGQTRKVFEAERKPNSQRNVKREAEYKKLQVEQETHKLDQKKTTEANTQVGQN